MKIMTFNTQHCLNYLEQKIDFDVMANAIKTVGADVVGLNEMRNEGPHPDYTNQVKTLADRVGFEHYYFAQAITFDGNPYGNGIISRYPIDEVKVVSIPDPKVKGYDGYYETRCVLVAKIKDYTLLVSHFGLNPDEEENAVKTVLSEVESEKCILMGDFNMKPDNAILAPIYERMTDTATAFENADAKTFPSDKPVEKIDYIFVSRDVKVLSAYVPEIIASDHRPLVAEIE